MNLIAQGPKRRKHIFLPSLQSSFVTWLSKKLVPCSLEDWTATARRRPAGSVDSKPGRGAALWFRESHAFPLSSSASARLQLQGWRRGRCRPATRRGVSFLGCRWKYRSRCPSFKSFIPTEGLDPPKLQLRLILSRATIRLVLPLPSPHSAFFVKEEKRSKQ